MTRSPYGASPLRQANGVFGRWANPDGIGPGGSRLPFLAVPDAFEAFPQHQLQLGAPGAGARSSG